MNLFTRHTQADHAEVLGNYLPGGRVFAGRADNNTNLYKLLFGLAEQLRLVEENLELTFEEFDITSTTHFLELWESALGIPDSCFRATGSIENRRRDVNVKFLADVTSTEQDFVDIAALYGIAATISPGFDQIMFPITFPYTFLDDKPARFTMFVVFEDISAAATQRFPLTFPIPFGDDNIEVLECLFRKLAPANVDVIFKRI